MRSINHRTATMVAAGVLGLGALVVAAPALAGNGPPDGPGPAGTATMHRGGPGMGAGSAMEPGYGMGFGHRDGACPGSVVTAEKGTLTAAQKTTLASMAQQEKLSQDLYGAFAARHDSAVFRHIAVAESHHLTAVRALLQRYDVNDPTADQGAGEFTDAAVQATYDKLAAQGEASLPAALAVGQQLERESIAGLKAAADGLTAADAKLVYQRLLTASERHLTAFSR